LSDAAKFIDRMNKFRHRAKTIHPDSKNNPIYKYMYIECNETFPKRHGEIMGKKLSIGKACALLGIAHFGPNIPLEEAGHEDRLRVFKEAAHYALTDEELDDILNTDDAALRLFIVGIFRAQCRLIKFVGPAGVREEFEHCVFHPPSKDAVIQAHLGLSMAESIFDQ
jgi:hypothetical protein